MLLHVLRGTIKRAPEERRAQKLLMRHARWRARNMIRTLSKAQPAHRLTTLLCVSVYSCTCCFSPAWLSSAVLT